MSVRTASARECPIYVGCDSCGAPIFDECRGLPLGHYHAARVAAVRWATLDEALAAARPEPPARRLTGFDCLSALWATLCIVMFVAGVVCMVTGRGEGAFLLLGGLAGLAGHVLGFLHGSDS